MKKDCEAMKKKAVHLKSCLGGMSLILILVTLLTSPLMPVMMELKATLLRGFTSFEAQEDDSGFLGIPMICNFVAFQYMLSAGYQFTHKPSSKWDKICLVHSSQSTGGGLEPPQHFDGVDHAHVRVGEVVEAAKGEG